VVRSHPIRFRLFLIVEKMPPMSLRKASRAVEIVEDAGEAVFDLALALGQRVDA